MKVSLELQPCFKNKSGIGVYTYELSKRLQTYSELDLHGNIFNFLGRNNNEEEIKDLHFRKHTCKLFPYGVYSRTWKLLPLSYNRLFKEEVDIYQFFNFIIPPKIQGTVVNTIHDLTFELYPETMDEKNLARLKSNLKHSIERPDKIITISESSKEGLVKYLDIPSEKIEIIYPGVEHEIYGGSYTDEEVSKVKSKYHLPKRYVLYMGTLEPRKNISTIIRGFWRFKKECDGVHEDLYLVLAGKKGWMYEEIFNLVEELQLQEKVIFTDYVDEKDKPIIYQQAEVFLFPSLYEGFGIPVLEAMAAGVPVITSNTSSLPEVVGDAGILVESKDIISIAEGIANILGSVEYRNELIKRGKLQAQIFNWDESAKKFYELYRSLK